MIMSFQLCCGVVVASSLLQMTYIYIWDFVICRSIRQSHMLNTIVLHTRIEIHFGSNILVNMVTLPNCFFGKISWIF